MLHYETIDSRTLGILKKLLSIELLSDLRLVGGTSLALQLGHRKSIDLDLFGNIDEDVLEITVALNSIGNITLLKNSKNIHVFLIDDLKVDIVNYKYPWLQDLIYEDNLRLAKVEDIAAMKLSAITGRGTKKDFVDLYFLLQKLKLAEMLEFYQSKYHDGSIFLVMKSLIFFEDAETDSMPDMLVPVDWKEVKETIRQAHKKYIKNQA